MKNVIIIVLINCLFLVSCNTIRNSAGVNRKVIDEYTVIENPPLVIPPNFNLLPPEQIEAKNIENADEELAKEILFGIDDNEKDIDKNNSLISKIIKQTKADEVDDNIRDEFNKEFAGQKSSIDDETTFESEEDLNAAIKATEQKDESKNIQNKKEKKKKRFFFF